MRYTILILFTLFLFGPIFALIMGLFHLQFDPPQGEEILSVLSLAALIMLLLMCIPASREHPQLVRGTLRWLAILFVILIIWAATPAITA